MKPEIKEKFAAALESGEFTQGRGRLHEFRGEANCYCAVGVLTELCRRELYPETPWVMYFFEDTENPFIGSALALPSEVTDWADVSPTDDTLDIFTDSLPAALLREIDTILIPAGRCIDAEVTSVTELNDAGIPFPLLAKIVREAL